MSKKKLSPAVFRYFASFAILACVAMTTMSTHAVTLFWDADSVPLT